MSKKEELNGGFDESRVINKDYLNSLNNIYKCGICFKIMDNPTDCESCGHSFCFECIQNLKCPFKCKTKKLKSSSQNLKDILSKIKFKCLNKDCNQILNYNDVKNHDKNCDFQEMICPNKGCDKKLIKKNLENHVINECQFTLIKCPYCDFQFNKNEITKHEKSCALINSSLKNENNNDINNIINSDANKINTDEYIKLLSMNVSKIIKDNKELIDINNKNENENSQAEFRPSNPNNYAQIDEEELLNIISEGIDEELKKYFLDFDKNFLKLSKDIKDIKELIFNRNQNKPKKEKEIKQNKKKNNILIINKTGDINKIEPIKEVKETEEEEKEDNLDDNYKTYIKEIISKTEDNIKNIINEMNNKIMEKLKLFSNKLEENIKKNNASSNNNNLTNQQKLIIENINNSIDNIIENIQETKSKINILSNDFHNKTPLFEELNKNLKENNNIKEKDSDKSNINNISEQIENIETTLNLIKNSVKQIIKTIMEEFTDLTELINKKKDSNNLLENNQTNNNNINVINKKENKLETTKDKLLSIDSLHKFSFGMDMPEKIQSPELLLNKNNSNKSTEQIMPLNLLKIKNQNFFLNPTNSDNNNNSLDAINNREISSNLNLDSKQQDINANNINLSNLEKRLTNLENFSKTSEEEIKQSISSEFNKQLKNFNLIIEKNLENKIGKMFNLKYCKDCEKVDYFYGFKKCASCENEICKQCINLCINCKILYCKKCCTCLKCNKNYCSKCRILCSQCNKKYCKNCMNNCSTCNKLLCTICLKKCFNCNKNNCDLYCSNTCYICNKNICNKCSDISEIKIIKCNSCNKNICEECSKVCEFCKKKICKNCEKSCEICKKKICQICIMDVGECFDCKKVFCKNCAGNNLTKKCELCNKFFCKNCEINFKNCYLCNNNICKNCWAECLCGNIYCNICSLECEKCRRRICNNCSAKCYCDIAVFCNECLKQNTETVLMHDCLYFINNKSVFDQKKTRSKISFNINNNFEIKLYITNINKLTKLLIGFTDNGNFKENTDEEIYNIYVVNLINFKKFPPGKKSENSFSIDLNSIKEENITFYLMIKNKQFLFKINEGEYKYICDLTKDDYWVYLEKINDENNNNINNNNNSNQNISNIDSSKDNKTSSDIVNDYFNSGIPKIKFIYNKII